MEQYLLQLPKRLAQEVRAGIAAGDSADVEMISGADNKHFALRVNGKDYPAKIAQLPTILETHKTYDDNFFYKSGEIGQIFVVADREEERKALEQQDEIANGITPPNTNVVKRKYDKTRKYTPFPKNDVARVEEDLVKIINGGVIEDVQEELVDFYDWMADAEHPNGIVVTDEMELIRQHPEYLTLAAEEPPSKQQKMLGGGAATASGGFRIADSVTSASAVNTPIVTDFGSEVESQAGHESAPRSPAFAPTPSPALSAQDGDGDDDKDVDDLEDDILGGMEEKLAAEPALRAYLTNPEYLKLLPVRERLQKSLRDAERDTNELQAKVEANTNIIVKNRFKQMLETAQKQRAEIAAELDKVQSDIAAFETG